MNVIIFESYYGASVLGEPYLMHHGVKGMKWGIRRYQNYDGTLTAKGKKRYGTVELFDEVAAARGKERDLKSEYKILSKKKKIAAKYGAADADKLSRDAIVAKEKYKQAKRDANVVDASAQSRAAGELAKKTHAENKAAAIAAGSSDVVKYVSELSTPQLRDAVNRVDMATKLRDIYNKEHPVVTPSPEAAAPKKKGLLKRVKEGAHDVEDTVDTVKRIKEKTGSSDGDWDPPRDRSSHERKATSETVTPGTDYGKKAYDEIIKKKKDVKVQWIDL